MHEGHFLFILTCLCLEKVVFFLLLLQDLGIWGSGWLWFFWDISATWTGVFLNKKLNHASVFPAGLRLAKNSQFFFTSRKLVYSFPSPPRHTYIQHPTPAHGKASLALQHTASPEGVERTLLSVCRLLVSLYACLRVCSHENSLITACLAIRSMNTLAVPQDGVSTARLSLTAERGAERQGDSRVAEFYLVWEEAEEGLLECHQIS